MEFVFQERPSDSPLVEKIWQTRSEYDIPFMSTAAAYWEMVVVKYQGEMNLHLRGPETTATLMQCPPDAEFVAITFKLGTFMPKMPTRSRLNQNDVILPEASSKSFWLNGAAWQFPTFENADTFVNRLVREGLLTHDPVVSDALRGYPFDLSPRMMQYRFLQATGLAQRTIDQIERARHALHLLQQGQSILDTVEAAGYSDQPHLTRALKQYIGQTPAQVGSLSQIELA
jgi:AraC-like DNA-binding protein